MHTECNNLLKLCKMKYIYVNDAKGELVFLVKNMKKNTTLFWMER